MDKNAKQKTVFDTDRQYLGDVYAKALLGVGQSQNNLDGLVEQLDSFVDAVNQLPKLKATLESPRISFEAKKSILSKILQGRSEKGFANFLYVVASKNRMDCLEAIQASVHEMFDEMAGRVTATLTTAEEVTEQVKQNVAQRLAAVLGKQVRIETCVDPSIIGGLVIRVGDTVYDGSVSNELKRVRSAAIDRANQEIRQSLDRFAMDA